MRSNGTRRATAEPIQGSGGRRRVPALLLVAALLASLVGFAAAPASAQGGMDNDFLSRINAARASNGAGPLSFHPKAQSAAAGWTPNIMANGLSHQNLAPLMGGGVTSVAENVGYGVSVDHVFRQFMDSANHRGNLLNPAYTHVGISTQTKADGQVWTTHVFMAVAGGGTPAPAPEAAAPPPPPPPPPSSSPPPPASEPPPPTAPPETTTTTKAPATSTTSTAPPETTTTTEAPATTTTTTEPADLDAVAAGLGGLALVSSDGGSSGGPGAGATLGWLLMGLAVGLSLVLAMRLFPRRRGSVAVPAT